MRRSAKDAIAIGITNRSGKWRRDSALWHPVERASKVANIGRVALFSASLHNELQSDDDRTFALAQRGLAMAFERNWSGAVTDLQNAAEGLV